MIPVGLLRFWPYAALLVAIAVFAGVAHHKGYSAGKAEIQTRFSAYIAKSDAIVAKAKQEAEAKEAQVKEANAKILADYQLRLDSSRSYGLSLASRLREYLSAAPGSNPVPETPGEPPIADSGETPSDTGIGKTIGAVFAECRDNADQLDALISQVKLQL